MDSQYRITIYYVCLPLFLTFVRSFPKFFSWCIWK